MAISKEAKVGILALIAGVILYLGFNFLKGYELFSNTNKYYVVYKDIDGLTVSNPVMVNGLTVGRVQNIRLLPDKNNELLVTVEVDEEVRVGDSSVALLMNSDLLGSKSIELVIGNNTTFYQSGDTIPGYKKQDITEALTQKAMPILTNLDSTVVKLNKVFGDELGTSVTVTLHNLEKASSDLQVMVNGNQKNIYAITSNLARLTASLSQTEQQLKPILTKFEGLADSLNDLELKETVKNASLALENVQTISSKINDNQGSLGQLVNDKALYDNLNKTIADLDKLVNDIQGNPKKYLKVSVF